MNENHPFEDMFDQIAELLKFVQDNASKVMDESDLPKGIEEKLSKLEKNVEKFKRMSDELVAQSGVPKQEMKSIMDLSSTELSVDEKRMLEKANQLKAQVEEAGAKFALAAEEGRQGGAALPVVPIKKKFGKKRRKKFKRFGGNDKWKPL